MKNGTAIFNGRIFDCGSIDKHMNLEIYLKNDEDRIFVNDFFNSPSKDVGFTRLANVEPVSVVDLDKNFVDGVFCIGESSMSYTSLTIKLSISKFVKG